MVLLVKIGDLFLFEADYPDGEEACIRSLAIINDLVCARGASEAGRLIVDEANAAFSRGEFTKREEK